MEIKNRREDLFTKELPPIIGEGSGGGITATVLWEGNVTSDSVDITAELLHPISDYVFLCVSLLSYGSAASSGILLVSNMQAGSDTRNLIVSLNPSLPIRITLDNDKVYISSTSSVGVVKLIGIK